MTVIPMRQPSIPENRGRLLTPAEVADVCFEGKVTPLWVRRNVDCKAVMSYQKVFYFEYDVRDWMLSKRVK